MLRMPHELSFKHRHTVVIRAAIMLLALVFVCAISLFGCSDSPSNNANTEASPAISASGNPSSPDQKNRSDSKKTIRENGSYTSKEEVALYIHTFGHLPDNYISKTKARKAGWDAEKGNLQKVCPGKSIGGGTFNNDDGLLPDKKGRTWTECDIDYHGGTRGAKRIVFSNDGMVFYTGDHYKSFERLY